MTIFENRGAMMGVSNPHPHCQIWADESLPRELFKDSQRQREYLERHARCLLCAYARREEEAGDVPFPCSMGFHQRPTDGDNHPEWHLHAHYYPPLLRSASIRKFVVGYELLAKAQRDTCPEEATATLRSQTSRSMITR